MSAPGSSVEAQGLDRHEPDRRQPSPDHSRDRCFRPLLRGRPIRCVVQLLWHGRTAEQRRATILHEALINRAFTDIAVSALCAYDQTRLEAGIAASAGLTHSMLIRDPVRAAQRRL
jgi:MEDS: MEthanogen/methylotroph, DcmR Sensory domain